MTMFNLITKKKVDWLKANIKKQMKFSQRSYYLDLSNRFNGANIMFLLEDGSSLIINWLSFSFSKKVLLSRVRILKSS